MIKLVRKDGSPDDARPLNPGKYTIGRSSDCDLRIDDATMSRKHASLEIIDSRNIYLTDLGSRNRTRVNGVIISSPVMLQAGDKVAFGAARFHVVSTEITNPTAGELTLVDTSDALAAATIVPLDKIRKMDRENVLYNPQTFKALSAIGQLPVDAENVDALLEQSLNGLQEAIGTNRAALLKVKGAEHAVSLRACVLAQPGGSADFAVSKTVVSEILSKRVAILVSDVMADARFADRESIIDAAVKSVMTMPLLDGEKIVGILYADTSRVGATLTEDHLSVFATFADILAAKLANHKLIRNRQEKAVLETSLRVSEEKQEELRQLNRQLRDTQMELVQSQKMASLKHLVAGIAHEMNTPLGALLAGLNTMDQAAGIMGQAFDNEALAEVLMDNPRPRRAVDALAATARVGKDSVERISTIVNALKSFAQLDRASLKDINVHEGLEATLALLKSELGDRIEVERDYGELPSIQGHAREINQVFMNLLLNAVQAIDGEGRITIKTSCENGFIVVTISDNGGGIPDENIDKLFDPGFTTKGVGVGAGLGLPIVYSIMQAHSGSVDVKSADGKGATFIVKIPIAPQKADNSS